MDPDYSLEAAVAEVLRQRAEIERLRAGLGKIAKRWPCSTADDMSRVAAETLGLAHQQSATETKP